MYTNYFGLKEKPFSIAPNPRYLYMSEQHQDALAHLLYGIQEGEGFVLLTGDIGTGKTTLCRSLLEQIPDAVEVAYIFNPKLSSRELLISICDEFEVPHHFDAPETSTKNIIDCLNRHLLDQHSRGRQSVLIIDEAQNLSIDVLEQIRLLTNLETNYKKLLQIVLIGQPELRDLFKKPELEQLSQRITARFHIGPLSLAEVGKYLNHRIFIAGGSQRPLFHNKAIKELHKLSKGVPRLINTLSDRALLATYNQTKSQVGKNEVQVAAAELLRDQGQSKLVSHVTLVAGCSFLILFSGYLLTYLLPNYYTSEITNVSVINSEHPSSPDQTQHPQASYENRFLDPPKQLNKLSDATKHEARMDNASRFTQHQLAHHARQSLLKRWNDQIKLPKNVDFCEFVISQGLRCLKGDSTLEKMLTLNRPAIVKIRNNEGKPYLAVLDKIVGQQAELVIAGRTKFITLDEFISLWTGQYEMLWRPPDSYSEAINASSPASAVQWFRDQLNFLANQPNSDFPIFIAPIEKQIMLFQKEVGLEADGLAGPETIITINNYSNIPSPLLTAVGDAS